jgi:hypothetical protein
VLKPDGTLIFAVTGDPKLSAEALGIVRLRRMLLQLFDVLEPDGTLIFAVTGDPELSAEALGIVRLRRMLFNVRLVIEVDSRLIFYKNKKQIRPSKK